MPGFPVPSRKRTTRTSAGKAISPVVVARTARQENRTYGLAADRGAALEQDPEALPRGGAWAPEPCEAQARIPSGLRDSCYNCDWLTVWNFVCRLLHVEAYAAIAATEGYTIDRGGDRRAGSAAARSAALCRRAPA